MKILKNNYIYKKIYASIIFILILFIEIGTILPSIHSGLFENPELILQDNFLYKEMLFEVYGKVNTIVFPYEIIRNNQQVVRRRDGWLSIPQADCDTLSQQHGLLELSDFCKKRNVNFLYCNYPAQAGNDQKLLEQGIYSFCDRRADRLLEFLQEKGIEYIDFRDELKVSGLTDEEIFYKTDHHWTTEAGFFAARRILEKCNKDMGYTFACDLLEEDKFVYTKYKNCWIGEIGKYVSRTWAEVLDDFVLIEPKYKTRLTLTIPDYAAYNRNGDFSDLINKDIYKKEGDIYNSRSWHYSYLFSNWGYGEIDNMLIENGDHILLVYDSFSLVVAPFMALASDKVILWDMRENTDSIYEYIDHNDVNIVVVAYTEGSSIAKEEMFNFR